MFLYGKNSVLERLKARPGTISKIFLRDNFEEPEILKSVHKNKIPFTKVSASDLNSIKPGNDLHLQGIVAKVEKFEYANFNDLLKGPADKRAGIIFLDRLFDPHNLGVIIRTAACFGGFSIVIPEHNACEITDAVLHIASGGENYTPVCMVKNLSSAIIKAKNNGYWIVGSVLSDDAQYLDKVSIPFPVGLVLGSEGAGIRYGVEKHIDIKVRIPMYGVELSFNVAIASAIFCYEISKQRKEAI